MDDKFINGIKVCLVYVGIMLIATFVFIGLFHTSLLESMRVFFYRGTIFLFISAGVSSVLLWLVKRTWGMGLFSGRDLVTIFFIFLGFTSTYFVLLPVTVERSISVYMLSYMDQNSQQGITVDDFERTFFQKYIEDYGAFQKRFDEQLLSKNISPANDGNGYVITDNGRKVVNLFRLCADIFNTEKWLVYPNDYHTGYHRE